MDYIKFFNEKMKEKVAKDPRIAEIEKYFAYCKNLKKEIRTNYKEAVDGFGYNLNNMSFSDIGLAYSGALQTINEWYDEGLRDYHESETRREAYLNPGYEDQINKKFEQRDNYYKKLKEFTNKYKSVNFYDLEKQEQADKAEYDKILKEMSKQVIVENINAPQLADYIDALIKEEKLKLPNAYDKKFNAVLKKEYIKMLVEDYKSKRSNFENETSID